MAQKAQKPLFEKLWQHDHSFDHSTGLLPAQQLARTILLNGSVWYHALDDKLKTQAEILMAGRAVHIAGSLLQPHPANVLTFLRGQVGSDTSLHQVARKGYVY